MAAWAIMKLMEDSVAAITRCLHAKGTRWPLCGWAQRWKKAQLDIDWGAAIYMLQRFGTRPLCFCSWGFTHRNRIKCVCLLCCNTDISKRAESDVLDGEDRQPGTHRNRQKNRKTAVMHKRARKHTPSRVNAITEHHRGAHKTMRLLHFHYRQYQQCLAITNGGKWL